MCGRSTPPSHPHGHASPLTSDDTFMVLCSLGMKYEYPLSSMCEASMPRRMGVGSWSACMRWVACVHEVCRSHDIRHHTVYKGGASDDMQMEVHDHQAVCLSAHQLCVQGCIGRHWIRPYVAPKR